MPGPLTLHQEALFLYRRVLRTSFNYPARPDRPGRTLRESLLLSGRSRFEANRTETDQAKIRSLIADGKKQIEALNSLTQGVADKQFPHKEEYIFPKIVYQADKLLSTNAQKAVAAKNKKLTGFWGGYFARKQGSKKEPSFRTTPPKTT